MAKITLTKEQRAKYDSLTPEKQKKYLRLLKEKQDAASAAPAPAATKSSKPTSKTGGNDADAIRAMFGNRKLNVREMADDVKSRDDGGVNWLKLESGEHNVRFLPPVQDTGKLATLVVQCWFDDPDSDEDKRKPYYSPRCVDPTAYCPVTTAYKAALNHPDEEFRKLADKIKPEKFYIANVLVFDAKSRSWNNEVLYMSPALYKDVAKKQIALSDPEDIGDDGTINSLGIADPLANRVVVIKREGAGKKTKWEVSLKDKTYQCTLDQLNARIDLDQVATPASDELLEDLVCNLFGIASVGELINAKVAKSKPAAKTTSDKKSSAKDSKASTKPKAKAVEIEDDDDITLDDLGDDADVVIDEDEEEIDAVADDIDVGDDDPLDFE